MYLSHVKNVPLSAYYINNRVLCLSAQDRYTCKGLPDMLHNTLFC